MDHEKHIFKETPLVIRKLMRISYILFQIHIYMKHKQKLKYLGGGGLEDEREA